jgi:CBS domain-containing protein
MSTDVRIVESGATLQEAARLMKEADVGPLPVLEGHRLIGMVTDRDLVVRAVAEGLDPTIVKVRDVLTPDIVYGFEDQEAEDAADLMARKRIRRLVVLDHDQRLVGMVSLGDLAMHGFREKSAEALECISRPSPPSGVPAR